MKKKVKPRQSTKAKKKASTTTARKKVTKASTKFRKPEINDSIYMSNATDPAHSPGHRKMNLKDSSYPQKQAPQTRMTKADKIQRTSATNRRIITGAALGKTGQITLK